MVRKLLKNVADFSACCNYTSILDKNNG
jgi:hypothetical protein